jgi:hypothetical protein
MGLLLLLLIIIYVLQINGEEEYKKLLRVDFFSLTSSEDMASEVEVEMLESNTLSWLTSS